VCERGKSGRKKSVLEPFSNRSLPDTACAYYEKENQLVLFFPITCVSYQVNIEEIPPGWNEFGEIIQKVIKVCKDLDRLNGERSGSYHASVPLTKKDWEWVLTFSHHQKTKTA